MTKGFSLAINSFAFVALALIINFIDHAAFCSDKEYRNQQEIKANNYTVTLLARLEAEKVGVAA